MRVLIIDDEPLAQMALAQALNMRHDVESFDVASDAIEGLERLEQNSYDVLLLDINMPGISGFEFLGRLKENDRPVPSIIIVTAHAEHAIAAFENHAVDYVLKPFSNERIGEALDIALHFGEPQANEPRSWWTFLHNCRQPSNSDPPGLQSRPRGRILFINPTEVIAVHAEGNYVLLQREAGSYLLRESISVMADKLKPYGFIRIHRSALVNVAFVEQIQPLATGEYALRLIGGKEFTVTQTYKKNLKDTAVSWISEPADSL